MYVYVCYLMTVEAPVQGPDAAMEKTCEGDNLKLKRKLNTPLPRTKEVLSPGL